MTERHARLRDDSFSIRSTIRLASVTALAIAGRQLPRGED